jgi:DNA-binding beta-propeller fold protein YncE
VADTGNHAVRSVDFNLKTVETLAGAAGQPGDSDGPRADARFRSPSGVARDANSGWTYVADTGNHAIRAFNATGPVGTLAGAPGQPGFADGTGAAARFRSPQGIDVDVSGNIYVADTGNHAVRKITPAGVVTTLGGDTPGEVTFVSPRGVAVDQALQLLYVADADTHTIYASQIGAGPGGSGSVFAPIAGCELDADIRDGPAMSARFNAPWGLAVDRAGSGAGDLYIADHGNAALRKLAVSGTVVTIALSGTQPGLSVTPASRAVGAGAGSASFAVSCPLAWTAAVVSGANWARITSGASGTGNSAVTLAHDANPAGGAARTASLRITPSSGNPVFVIIEQAANPGTNGNDNGTNNNNSGNGGGDGGGGGGAPTLPALALLAALLALRARKKNCRQSPSKTQ